MEPSQHRCSACGSDAVVVASTRDARYSWCETCGVGWTEERSAPAQTGGWRRRRSDRSTCPQDLQDTIANELRLLGRLLRERDEAARLEEMLKRLVAELRDERTSPQLLARVEAQIECMLVLDPLPALLEGVRKLKAEMERDPRRSAGNHLRES